MEARCTSFSSAENSFIEVYKLFVKSKFFDALELCCKVPEPDCSTFLIKNLKANIQLKIGGYEQNFLDFYSEFKNKSNDVIEKCRISLSYAKILKKCKRFSESLKECEFIIEQSDQDIKLAEIDLYSYRAHQIKGELLFDMLCFQTSKRHLDKAEQIILEIDQEKPEKSYLMMKHKRIVAEYNRKFQKYNQSIELLLEILKNERKIYKELTNNIVNKLINENEGEELPNSEPAVKADSEDDLKVEDVDSAPTENSHAISKTEFERTIDSLKIKRSIHYQLGITMSQIMYIHAVKRDYSKAVTFKTEAEKYLLDSVNHDKNHYIIAQFYQNVGDMHLRIDGAKDKDIAYEFYDKANKIFELVIGNISIDYK